MASLRKNYLHGRSVPYGSERLGQSHFDGQLKCHHNIALSSISSVLAQRRFFFLKLLAIDKNIYFVLI